MKNYSYPRVITSVTALPHSNARPAAEDTTILFVPIISTTGPAGELVKIHSLEEFRSTFGLDSDRLGLTLLNISNWLTAGGTLYTYRLVKTGVRAKLLAGDTANHEGENPESPVPAKYSLEVESKFVGSFLNDYYIKTIMGDKTLEYVLYRDDKKTRIEHKILPLKELEPTEPVEEVFDLENKSEYLKSIKIIHEKGCFYSTEDGEVVTVTKVIEGSLTGGSDGWEETTISNVKRSAYEVALLDFWADPKAIENRLESPIDLIMDAGYALDIKKLMIKAISHEDSVTGEVDAVRPDINGYFDLANAGLSTIEEGTIKTTLFDGSECYKKTSNIFFYDQSLVISEEAFFDKDITVYPSYFLSSMVPNIDLTLGIQYPVAGKRRGEIVGIKKISKNPTPDEKEELFLARVNYIEKDSRGYYFMSQRTFDGSSDEEFSGLSFINNARVACRMVHELEALGREYLFEFNDAITLANMTSVMNRYVSNWIANRTLSFGNVEVSADPYSEEKVNAVLNIKFTNTIETISIDLIIQ